MPFIKGPAPIRKTLRYLQNYNLIFKDRVQVFSLHYNSDESLENHKGARDFAFWAIPQLQYKNPEVQILTYKNMTPSPFIRIFCDNGEDILVDIDGKSRKDIDSHLMKILGKTQQQISRDEKSDGVLPNPAHFGWGTDRECMCEVLGQVPCPGVIKLPNTWRGKYAVNPDLLDELNEPQESSDY